MNIYNKYECCNRIVKEFDTEAEAFEYEIYLIEKRKFEGQAEANFHEGGFGGDVWKYAPQEKKDEFIEKMRIINGERKVFESRKSMLEYFSKSLNFTPSNHTLAKLFKGEEYKAFRKDKKHLDGMKISYIKEGVETIENLPEDGE